jgi:hypothetical protein
MTTILKSTAIALATLTTAATAENYNANHFLPSAIPWFADRTSHSPQMS